MNDFRIDVRDVQHDDGRGAWKAREAVFYVDGRQLLELIADAERPFATTEGAGEYTSPPPSVALAPSRHLLGEPAGDGWGEECDDGKIAIGGCECGVIGCWPLLVRIETRPDVVVWSDFENPFRGSTWDWSSVGPFVFARGQYEQELRSPSGPPSARA